MGMNLAASESEGRSTPSHPDSLLRKEMESPTRGIANVFCLKGPVAQFLCHCIAFYSETEEKRAAQSNSAELYVLCFSAFRTIHWNTIALCKPFCNPPVANVKVHGRLPHRVI